MLDDHDELLNRGDVVVAGDVNCSAQSSPEMFEELLDHISDRYGLRSAYHQLHRVRAGAETDMTLWWRGKEDAGFHCDLVLVPEAWKATAVTVGSYADWGAAGLAVSSDHAPVVADLERVRSHAVSDR